MDEKDTLKKMFMDMSDANEWAKQVMNPTGFVTSDGEFMNVDRLQEQIDDFTKSIRLSNENDTLLMHNLYYYRGFSKAYLEMDFCSDFERL